MCQTLATARAWMQPFKSHEPTITAFIALANVTCDEEDYALRQDLSIVQLLPRGLVCRRRQPVDEAAIMWYRGSVV